MQRGPFAAGHTGRAVWVYACSLKLFSRHLDASQRRVLQDFAHVAEGELQRTWATLRFQALIEQASDITAVLDADGTLRYLSPAAERLLAYPRHERLGRSALEHLDPADVPGMREHLIALVQTPATPVVFECRLQHRDGTWRTFEGGGAESAGRSGRGRAGPQPAGRDGAPTGRRRS